MGEKSVAWCVKPKEDTDTDDVDTDEAVRDGRENDASAGQRTSKMDTASSQAQSLQRSSAGGDGWGGQTGTGFTAYDPGPDRSALSDRYGLDFVKDGQAQRIQRLESTYGDDRVAGWASEGMTVEAMGKPQDMAAFRTRQAQRSDDVPADVERQNQASVQRNTSPDRSTDAGEPDGATQAVRDVVSAPGHTLDESVQREMESSVGGDFGDVRLHTGPKAANAAEQINARAFTVGNHVAFNRGEYDPDSDAGRKVLAHELTHVRQQTGGEVSMLPKEGALQIDPDPQLEREAQAAERVVADGGATTVSRLGSSMHVQRSPDDESSTAEEAGNDGDETEEGDIMDGLEGLEDDELLRALFHRVLVHEVGKPLFEQLAAAESADDARAAFDDHFDSDAMETLATNYAEHVGIPKSLLQLDVMVIGLEPGTVATVAVLPRIGTATSLPSEGATAGDGITAGLRLQPFAEDDDLNARELMKPFLDLVSDDDHPIFVLDFDKMDVVEGDDGPVLVMQQGDEEMEMDIEGALQEALDIFMESERGQKLQAKAEALGDDAKEYVEETWESTWGKVAISGVALAIVGGALGILYATEEQIPEEAVEWVNDNLEVSYSNGSLELEFEPELEGLEIDYGEDIPDPDLDVWGGTLDASYDFDDDTSIEGAVEFLDEEGERTYGGELEAGGESWEASAEAEYTRGADEEDGELAAAAAGTYEGDDVTVAFESELEKLRDGLDDAEGQVGAEFSGENLELEGDFEWDGTGDETEWTGGLGGKYGDDTTFLGGEVELRNTEDDSGILTGLEGGLGGDIWSVDAGGELELSENGHRWLAQAGVGFGEEDEWDARLEGFMEGHSMDDMRHGLSFEGNYYGENLTLSGSGDYNLTLDGDRELESDLKLSYEAANRLKLQSKALLEHSPEGTSYGAELGATIQHLENLETEIGASYRQAVEGDAQWQLRSETRYRMDRIDLHLTNTVDNDEFQVLFGVSGRF